MTDHDPPPDRARAEAAARGPESHDAPRPALTGHAGPGEGATPAAAAGGRPARWDVAALCGDTGEAILVHKGDDYRLRITARGRLILTK